MRQCHGPSPRRQPNGARGTSSTLPSLEKIVALARKGIDTLAGKEIGTLAGEGIDALAGECILRVDALAGTFILLVDAFALARSVHCQAADGVGRSGGGGRAAAVGAGGQAEQTAS